MKVLLTIDDGQTVFVFEEYDGEHPVSRYGRMQHLVLTGPRLTPDEGLRIVDADRVTPAPG